MAQTAQKSSCGPTGPTELSVWHEIVTVPVSRAAPCSYDGHIRPEKKNKVASLRATHHQADDTKLDRFDTSGMFPLTRGFGPKYPHHVASDDSAPIVHVFGPGRG